MLISWRVLASIDFMAFIPLVYFRVSAWKKGGSILVLGRRRLYPIRPREEQDQVVPWYFQKEMKCCRNLQDFFHLLLDFFER